MTLDLSRAASEIDDAAPEFENRDRPFNQAGLTLAQVARELLAELTSTRAQLAEAQELPVIAARALEIATGPVPIYPPSADELEIRFEPLTPSTLAGMRAVDKLRNSNLSVPLADCDTSGHDPIECSCELTAADAPPDGRCPRCGGLDGTHTVRNCAVPPAEVTQDDRPLVTDATACLCRLNRKEYCESEGCVGGGQTAELVQDGMCPHVDPFDGRPCIHKASDRNHVHAYRVTPGGQTS